MTAIAEALQSYRDLAERLDEKFREIQNGYKASFACQEGCHSCCKPGLTINELEVFAIREHLTGKETLVKELAALAQENPHQGKRCSFLSAQGSCGIYQSRPFVCRSHGAPLQVRPLVADDENTRVRDVCPLNFKGQSLAKLPPKDVINLDTINTLLALLAKKAYPKSEKRVPLELQAILQS